MLPRTSGSTLGVRPPSADGYLDATWLAIACAWPAVRKVATWTKYLPFDVRRFGALLVWAARATLLAGEREPALDCVPVLHDETVFGLSPLRICADVGLGVEDEGDGLPPNRLLKNEVTP